MKKLLLLLVAFLLHVSVAPAGNWFGAGPWANGAYYPGQLDGRYFATVYNNVGGTFSKTSLTNSYNTTNQVVTTVITNVGGLSVTNRVTTNVVQGPFYQTNTIVTGSVVSGILGFGIRNGTPAFGQSQGVSSNSSSSAALQSLSLDNSLNNFLVYVNGDVYVGTTAANINPKNSTVSGVLANGAGRPLYQLFTNQTAGLAAVANSGVEIVSLPSATANGYFNASVNNNKTPYTFNGSGVIDIASASGSGELQGSHSFNVDGIKTSEDAGSAYQQTQQAAPAQ